MRVLCQDEISAVAGGMQAAPGGGGGGSTHHWWDGIVDWIDNHFGGGGGGGGLSQDQARQGCQDLGRGLNTVEAGIVRKAYPGDEVQKVCENAVNNVVNWQDKSPAAVCEEVDGGRWNKTTRSCDP